MLCSRLLLHDLFEFYYAVELAEFSDCLFRHLSVD